MGSPAAPPRPCQVGSPVEAGDTLGTVLPSEGEGMAGSHGAKKEDSAPRRAGTSSTGPVWRTRYWGSRRHRAPDCPHQAAFKQVLISVSFFS